MKTKIQPEQIEKYLINKRLMDEMGWTGEFRVSAKDIIDMLIDLPFDQVMSQKELIDKAEDFIISNDIYADIIKDRKLKKGAKFMEEFVMSLYESGIIDFKNSIK